MRPPTVHVEVRDLHVGKADRSSRLEALRDSAGIDWDQALRPGARFLWRQWIERRFHTRGGVCAASLELRDRLEVLATCGCFAAHDSSFPPDSKNRFSRFRLM